MLIVLIAMSVLVPVLAALQYYWLGEVSQRSTERLESSLHAGAMQFRRDFNRELIRAYLSFLIDSSSSSPDLQRFHAERLRNWNQAAPFPKLISDVFIIELSGADPPRLTRLNLSTQRLEPSEWKGELAQLQNLFVRKGHPSQSSKPLDSFAEEIPALIIPFPLDTNRQPGPAPPFPDKFTLVKLDLDYIQSEFMPALIQRHFGDPLNPYSFTIRSVRDSQQVIYSTNRAADFSSYDASTLIFGLESDEVRAFLHTEAGVNAGSAQPGMRQLRLINLRPLAPSGSKSPGQDGRWQLLIKHSAGSLAAAVSGARRRNLAISFGILMLLGAGIFMTALSTWRAQRLARQQINFVAGVTHELRTPLAVICSAGENLADRIVDTPQKAADYGKVIYTEGRRLSEMVEQVLEFAGAQSGRQNYVMKPTEVGGFIDDAVAACRNLIDEKDFKVETQIQADLPLIMGNASALKRAVQNLLSNAIKYDGENHWARVTAETSPTKHKKEVLITVEDRGRGISPTDIPYIFEPFYRGREAIAAQTKGSGVGLSLVKQIAEAHGGRVTVKSSPAVGSLFTLHLPVAGDQG